MASDWEIYCNVSNNNSQIYEGSDHSSGSSGGIFTCILYGSSWTRPVCKLWVKIFMWCCSHNFNVIFFSFQDTPFDNPEITLAETISQVIGSPDFSIFRLMNDGTVHRQVPFKTLSVIIWVVFGVGISVLFITFLVRFGFSSIAVKYTTSSLIACMLW